MPPGLRVRHARPSALPLLPAAVVAAVVLVAASGAVALGPGPELSASRAEALPASVPDPAGPAATPVDPDASSPASSSGVPERGDPSSAAPVATEVVLSVEEVPQETFRPGAATGDRPAVALTCRVQAPDSSSPLGTTTFLDAGAVIAIAPAVPDGSGAAVGTMTAGSLRAGPHDLSCTFTGAPGYADSTSAVVALPDARVLPEVPTAAAQAAEPPTGGLSITTPFTAGSPLTLGPALLDTASSTFSAQAPLGDAERGYLGVLDEREGDLGFSVSVVASPFASPDASFPGRHVGLLGLRAMQVPGSALRAEDVTLTDRPPFDDGLDTAKEFLSYPPSLGRGEVRVTGFLGVSRVPTSAPPGRYTSTVVFTVL